ncbi:hypothetical protein FDI40_gp434 [Agrobacterium phage Atu_ph07]|uniref:Uncharacterized protein n=1 Tax=Agrobacterium phage Atu_ph07 TaxID=2024264 RepID=A0A2L0V087_9CAUD|nr:hypothetical protein FDI40_gp434 [Agrobacterium phage Atu_ph07]AUZ95193.1 hypothetical protein [Agrobacterium phage Atu_ph07]
MTLYTILSESRSGSGFDTANLFYDEDEVVEFIGSLYNKAIRIHQDDEDSKPMTYYADTTLVEILVDGLPTMDLFTNELFEKAPYDYPVALDDFTNIDTKLRVEKTRLENKAIEDFLASQKAADEANEKIIDPEYATYLRLKKKFG